MQADRNSKNSKPSENGLHDNSCEIKEESFVSEELSSSISMEKTLKPPHGSGLQRRVTLTAVWGNVKLTPAVSKATSVEEALKPTFKDEQTNQFIRMVTKN